jgi:hypothetical protein
MPSDFHGTLAFSLRAKAPGQAPILVVGSSTLGIPYTTSMVCRNLHNGKPQASQVWRERSLSEVSHMWYWKSEQLQSLGFEEVCSLCFCDFDVFATFWSVDMRKAVNIRLF